MIGPTLQPHHLSPAQHSPHPLFLAPQYNLIRSALHSLHLILYSETPHFSFITLTLQTSLHLTFYLLAWKSAQLSIAFISSSIPGPKLQPRNLSLHSLHLIPYSEVSHSSHITLALPTEWAWSILKSLYYFIFLFVKYPYLCICLISFRKRSHWDAQLHALILCIHHKSLTCTQTSTVFYA
jgi:hypothetical protein